MLYNRIEPNKIGKGISPLCFMPDGSLVCYQYGDVVLYKNGIEERRFTIFRDIRERILGRLSLINRLLRLGVRTAEAIDDESIVFSIGNTIYELNVKNGTLSDGYYCGKGVRPLSFTSVSDISGFDDGIYFGGYMINIEKFPVHVYQRKDKDKWDIVYTYPQGTINHVHTIVSDCYRQCLWVFTGDYYESAAIWKVTDGFKKVERIVCNEQKYRGCIAFPLPEGLFYATDAPYADNYIYLMNPNTYDVQALFPLSGSCIYGCQWKNKYVFSTTVEPDGRDESIKKLLFSKKIGRGIKDRYVHMYMGNIDNGFCEIYKEKKDIIPFLFQFGAFKFPSGVNNTETLYFQPVATNKNDLSLLKLCDTTNR